MTFCHMKVFSTFKFLMNTSLASLSPSPRSVQFVFPRKTERWGGMVVRVGVSLCFVDDLYSADTVLYDEGIIIQ